ncbi:hypothetical protein O181_026787 [Austropuccinia psidii MF-1]|uniref:Multidrug resistance-associated protein 1 n=1 Tax=Austropuccinia psidii MF-1 TaxID=1389203 RepID=A0A9Q3CNQ7_9BASI|nr:hypothetical protein [Austropuccinia psidii MF-1]
MVELESIHHQIVLKSSIQLNPTKLISTCSFYPADPNSVWSPFDPLRFNLSTCFIHFLYILPLIIIFLGGSIDLLKLSSRSNLSHLHHLSKLILKIKLSLAFFLFLSQSIYSIYLFISLGWLDQVQATFNLLIILSFFYSIPIIHYSHLRSKRSSTSLLFFYLSFLFISAIQLKSLLDNSSNDPHLPSQLPFLIIRSSLLLIIFVLECLGPLSLPSSSSNSKSYSQIPQDQQHQLDDESFHLDESPFVYANIFSRLTFTWMSPLMKSGKNHSLTEQDIWPLPRADQSDALTNQLQQQWQRELIKNQLNPSYNPSLILAVIKTFGLPYLAAAILKSIQDILQFIQPQLLRRLLQFIESRRVGNSPQPSSNGYLIAIAMFSCGLIQTLFLHQYFQRVFLTGMRIRSGLIGIIYKKALVLSSEGKAGKPTGDIVNLMSTDVARIQDNCSYGLILVSGIFQIGLAFISLYQMLGWSMLGGIVVVVLSIPLNTTLARAQSRLQKRQMKNKDQRTRLMNEILNNIRSIKLYTWENAFSKKMFSIRNDKELTTLRKIGYLVNASTALWTFIPFLVAFSAFSLFSLVTTVPLTPALVFPAISLFQLLQFPLAVLPMVISQSVEAYVSIQRIYHFLTSSELQQTAILRTDTSGEEHEKLVAVKDAHFSWSLKASLTLSQITLSVSKTDLVAIVGRVGSGKSSLLSGILGEMNKVSGTVELRGKVAYTAQSPWLLSSSVKENILFGSRYDQDIYQTVIEACALIDDLAILKDGDETLVGEKGISLSGGQKARISLARAVYARADVYLLDDPLSSVDAHVARHLFERVIGPAGLLRGKARVLCTNAIPYCQQADELIMLKDGKIVERGSFESVLEHDGELKKLIDEFGHKATRQELDENSSKATTLVPSTSSSQSDGQSLSKKATMNSEVIMRRPSIRELGEHKKEMLQTLNRPGNPKEHKEVGSVKMDIYKKYIQSTGLLEISIMFAMIILQQVFSVSTTLWLKYWSTTNELSHSGRNTRLGYFLGIYGLLGASTTVASYIQGVFLFSVCAVRSGKVLHDEMFHRVLRAPMSFFDTTPVGVILNRFSRDVFVIDEVLARVFSSFFRTSASVISVVAVVSWTLPPFLAVCIPLMLVYRSVQIYYLATSRELKRIDATTKSPIFALFGETLAGMATIRAYGEQGRFIGENEFKVDRNQQAYFASIASNRWLGVRLEMIGNILILTAALLSVSGLASSITLDSGMVGVLMSYVLSITQSLNWLVRSATEVETNIVSCERVIEYTKLKQEATFETDEHHKPGPNWPDKGAVDYEDYQCKYRDELDLVLKGVNFKVKPQEKIGICGRTGAGKSTITLSLFRLIEKFGGRIMIDGIDISQIGLRDLRSKISIIPQDSQCFEGTLRDNLDPEGIKTDEELWKALEHSRLKSHIQSLEGGLDGKIEEGGANLSNGQRQLLCLSRALLRSSKILVLDEATSSVDPETDLDIQAVIRTEFKGCTILVIAHRLNTILDCDRILVISKGKVVEFDEPKKLLEDSKSEFYGMCKESGQQVMHFLYIISNGQSTQQTGERFQRGQDSVHCAFHATLKAMCNLYPTYASQPDGANIPQEILKNPNHSEFRC